MQQSCKKDCYFCLMRLKLIFLLAVLFHFGQAGLAQIKGVVLDLENAPLPGASVLLLPDSIATITGKNGKFEFTGLKNKNYLLRVRFVGFETQEIKVKTNEGGQKWLKVVLELSSEVLNTVVISDEHAKQEMTLSSEHISEDFIDEHFQGTFAKTLERLPGISAINVGVGIAKPVIRGLSSNRIIVNQQGIKQESHQWGADHGLEIDQYDVDRVEIIKGPASLQYGSDGLGGVINIMPARIPQRNSVEGELQGIYKTNNEHWGGSARLAGNYKDLFISARYSKQAFGDYRVPDSLFQYNSFDLPIYNERLKNTAGQEENIRISVGLKKENSITRLLFGHYSLDAGLFSGAVGVPRSYTLEDDGNPRDLDVPRQNIDHYRVTLQQAFYFGDDHLDIKIGYQRNNRREHSFPEFHSIPSSLLDPGNTLALGLDLQTISGNLHYEHRVNPERKFIYGGNVQWQDNRRGGFEFLLPNFNTFRGGLFGITEWNLRPNWTVNGGIRFDAARNDTEFYRQFVWDSNENITDSLIAPQTDENYFNWSASIGSSLRYDKWIFKANLGKSFRVPYPAETVSNGIHHGTFRHEVGTPDLKSEHGYQLDLSLEFDFDRFKGGVSTYFNYFENYIYLGPTFPAKFSTLPEAGQIFQYRQDDAIYTGFELQWNWGFWNGFELNQSADFVQSFNPETSLALPFTPQPSLKHHIRYSLPELEVLKNVFVEIEHQYFFAARGNLRVDRSERPTPAYQLWTISTGMNLVFWGQELQLNAQVQNLMDASYLNHLSRYRLINVAEQGRNVVLSLKVPLGVY